MAGAGNPKTGGRKKGTKNKASVAKEEALAKSGMTPLEYLLSVMVDENLTRSERTDAAKAAAPYIHPRLSQVKHQGDEKAPIPIVFSKAEEGLL